MSTHNLCFQQKYEKYDSFFLSENFKFLEEKFSIYLNRHVFVMRTFTVPTTYVLVEKYEKCSPPPLPLLSGTVLAIKRASNKDII